MIRHSRAGAAAAVALVVGMAQAQDKPALPAKAVAIVNSQVITEGELGEFLGLRYGPLAMKQLLTTRLIMGEVERKGLAVTPEDVEALLVERIAQQGGEEAFNRILRRRGITRDYVRAHELTPEVGLRKLADLILPKAATDKELMALLQMRYGPPARRPLVVMHLIQRELDRQKLAVTEAEIETTLSERIAKSGGEEAFNRILQRTGATLDYVKKYELTPQTALAKLVEPLKSQTGADQELVEAFTRRFGERAPSELVLQHLVNQELTRLAVSITDAEVEALLGDSVARSGGAVAFAEVLRRRDLTLDSLKQYELTPEIGRRKVADALKGKVVVKKELDYVLVTRFGRQAAQQVVMVRLFKQELQRNGLSVKKAEIDALVKKRMERGGGEEAYLRRLQRSDIALEYVKAYELTTEIALGKLTDRLKPQLASDKAFADLLVKRQGLRAVQQLVLLRLLSQELARRGLKVTDAEVEALLAKRIELAGGKEAYEEYLRGLNLTLAYVRHYELPAGVARRKLTKDSISVTDEDVRRLFLRNHGEKRQVRRIVLDNILVANDVLKQLEEGADFTTLARRQSRDPRARRDGGLRPPFGKWALASPLRALEDTAFKLEVGKHSGIIQVGRYFYIIKLERVIPPKSDVTFDEVKDKMREMLWDREVSARSRVLIADLHRKAEIVVRPAFTQERPADG